MTKTAENSADFGNIEAENDDATAKTTLPKVLNYDEIDRLLLAVSDIEDLLSVRLMLFAGLRVSEVADLLVKDIDTERIAVFVRQGKWAKDRWTPCDVHTVSLAKCYAGLTKWDGDHHLISSSTRTIQRHVEEIYKRAGIIWGPTCHTLRHTCATWQLDRGVSLEVVRENMGHEDVSTTQIYLHLNIRQRSRTYREATRFL